MLLDIHYCVQLLASGVDIGSGSSARRTPANNRAVDGSIQATKETIKRIIASRSGGLLEVVMSDSSPQHYYQPPGSGVSESFELVQTSHQSVFQYMRTHGLELLDALCRATESDDLVTFSLPYAHFRIFQICCHCIKNAASSLPPKYELSGTKASKEKPVPWIGAGVSFICYAVGNIFHHGDGALPRKGAHDVITKMSHIFERWATWESGLVDCEERSNISYGLLRSRRRANEGIPAKFISKEADMLRISIYTGLDRLTRAFVQVNGLVKDRKSKCDLTPLYHAIKSKNCSILSTLLDAGAPCDEQVHTTEWCFIAGRAQSSLPRTPLMLAVLLGASDNARLLVDHGADVNARNSGATVLMVACGLLNTDLVRYLNLKGADVNTVTESGTKVYLSPASLKFWCRTALRAACHSWRTRHASKTSLGAIRLLLENGADPNVGDLLESVCCQIHRTCELGSFYRVVVQWLIEFGAQTTTPIIVKTCLMGNFFAVPALLVSVDEHWWQNYVPVYELLNHVLRYVSGLSDPDLSKHEAIILDAAKAITNLGACVDRAGGNLSAATVSALATDMPLLKNYVCSFGGRPSAEQWLQCLEASLAYRTYYPRSPVAIRMGLFLEHGGSPHHIIEKWPFQSLALIDAMLCIGDRKAVDMLTVAGADLPGTAKLNALLICFLDYVSFEWCPRSRVWSERTFCYPEIERHILSLSDSPRGPYMIAVWQCCGYAHRIFGWTGRPPHQYRATVPSGLLANVGRCLLHFGAQSCDRNIQTNPTNGANVENPELEARRLDLLDYLADCEIRANRGLDLYAEPGLDEFDCQCSDRQCSELAPRGSKT